MTCPTSTHGRHRWIGRGLDVRGKDLVRVERCGLCGTERLSTYTNEDLRHAHDKHGAMCLVHTTRGETK